MAVAEGQSFGQKLKSLREAAKLTPYQLAKKAKLSGQAVTMLEQGVRQPTWDTVLKLARALGVQVGEFDTGVSDSDETSPQPNSPK